MTRAFGYLRVSGKGQIIGDGFPRQRKAIEAYAASHGIRIMRFFEERGVSGTIEGMDRPVWAEMIGLMLGDGVRMILVEGLGRLSRELLIQEWILRDMGQRGLTLISVTEPDLDGDPTRVMLRQIVGAVHQYERSMICLKLAGARRRMKAKTGRCEGRKPYGERDGEPEVIERIKALRAKGYGYDLVASQLNADGIMPRSGRQWHGSTINGILRRLGA
jgi:DNA invertase Pin-like site-specific DNA recombinase